MRSLKMPTNVRFLSLRTLNLFWLFKFILFSVFFLFFVIFFPIFLLLDCPGPQSESAGKSDACAGCPNQEACASAPKGPDPGTLCLFFFEFEKENPCFSVQFLLFSLEALGFFTSLLLPFELIELDMLILFELFVILPNDCLCPSFMRFSNFHSFSRF